MVVELVRSQCHAASPIGPAQTANAVDGCDQPAREQWRRDLENRKRYTRDQRERRRLVRDSEQLELVDRSRRR